MFRRKQDEEDPFAALKDAAERGSATVSGGSPRVAPPPRQTAAPGQVSGIPGGEEKAQRSAPAGVPGAPRQPRGNGFLVLLVVVLSLGGAGAAVWATARDTSSGASGGSAVVSSGPGGSRAPGTARAGAAPRAPPPAHYDLLRPATFKQAMNGVQQKLRPGERVWLIRVARDRINTDTRLRDGRQRLINVDDQLRVDSMVAGDAGDRTALAIGSIDPQAPSRAVRKAAAQGRFPTRKLDYLVLLSPSIPGQAPTWSLFFKGVSERNEHWIASLDGNRVYRPGDQPVSSGSSSSSNSVTIRTDAGTTTLTGTDAVRVLACVRRAGADGGKIQDCLP